MHGVKYIFNLIYNYNYYIYSYQIYDGSAWEPVNHLNFRTNEKYLVSYNDYYRATFYYTSK